MFHSINRNATWHWICIQMLLTVVVTFVLPMRVKPLITESMEKGSIFSLALGWIIIAPHVTFAFISRVVSMWRVWLSAFSWGQKEERGKEQEAGSSTQELLYSSCVGEASCLRQWQKSPESHFTQWASSLHCYLLMIVLFHTPGVCCFLFPNTHFL